MKPNLLDILRCPNSGQRLRLEVSDERNGEVVKGTLHSECGRHQYPIKESIPRFVPASNYTDNFGMQWNLFSRTQLDSHNGLTISADRFWKATGWRSEEIRDQWVLDAGCGSGRFAEVALQAGAKVIALDYSSAIDACYRNLKHHPNFHVVQGNIYALPFEKHTFPFVYSLGVLQHTPNVRDAFFAVSSMPAPGGQLCVDYYEKTFKSFLLPKYWLRPFTKRQDQVVLFKNLKRHVPGLLKLSRAAGSVPFLGKQLKRLVPVANYDGIYPLSESLLHEFALLDTFDMLAPQYDKPQDRKAVRAWMEEASFRNIQVLVVGHLVVRGVK